MDLLSNPDALANKVKGHAPQFIGTIIAELGKAAQVPEGIPFGVLLFNAPTANGPKVMATIYSLSDAFAPVDEHSTLDVEATVRAMPNAAIMQLLD